MLNLRAIERLDPRIRAIVAAPDNAGDVGALHLVVKLAAKIAPSRREQLFNHFATRLPRRLRDHVRRLHAAYNEVAAELAAKDEAFDAWLQSVRTTSGKAKTVEGEPV